MAEQRFTVGDQITVVVTGEMTGITPDGTLTVQYPSSLGACETHVELQDTSVVVMHERDADKATPVLIEERDSARAEVELLRAERDRAEAKRDRLAEQVQRVRALHEPITGLPGIDGAVCRHCLTYDGQTVPAPCPTIRALDGTEATP